MDHLMDLEHTFEKKLLFGRFRKCGACKRRSPWMSMSKYKDCPIYCHRGCLTSKLTSNYVNVDVTETTLRTAVAAGPLSGVKDVKAKATDLEPIANRTSAIGLAEESSLGDASSSRQLSASARKPFADDYDRDDEQELVMQGPRTQDVTVGGSKEDIRLAYEYVIIPLIRHPEVRKPFIDRMTHKWIKMYDRICAKMFNKRTSHLVDHREREVHLNDEDDNSSQEDDGSSGVVITTFDYYYEDAISIVRSDQEPIVGPSRKTTVEKPIVEGPDVTAASSECVTDVVSATPKDECSGNTTVVVNGETRSVEPESCSNLDKRDDHLQASTKTKIIVGEKPQGDASSNDDDKPTEKPIFDSGEDYRGFQ